MQKITPFLMFKSRGQEAVNFYVSVFPESTLHNMIALPDDGTLLNASFALNGQDFIAMDGGPHFSFSQGISLFISCDSQQEVDYYWEKLSEGGEPGRCGWLTDKFGVSWQVVPTALGVLMGSSNAEQAERVRQAMLAMNKLEISGLQAAYDGD